MEKTNENRTVWKKISEELFKKNWKIKIIALVVAMLLWGLVLTSEDPYRMKTLPEVRIMFDGEADLIARDLVVRGDRDEILQNVRVNVNTRISNYKDVSADDVNAVINLRNITSKGERRLPVSVSVPSQVGNIDSISPSTISVEIDALMEKIVPVEVELVGEVPQGYWHGIPQLGDEFAQIRGAEQDVSRVAKAVCYVDCRQQTDSYNEAVDVVYLDEKGDQINDNMFLSCTSSVAIRMDILMKKTVPVNLKTVLIGADELAPNYEIKSVTCKPDTVEIIGEKNVLDGIQSLELQGVNVAGASDNKTTMVSLIVPEGVDVLGSDMVQLFVTIQEKKMERTFTDSPIEIRGLDDSLKAELDVEMVNITVNGRVSAINALDDGDIIAYIDVSRRKEGVYEQEVGVATAEDQTLELESVSCSPERVQVRLMKK